MRYEWKIVQKCKHNDDELLMSLCESKECALDMLNAYSNHASDLLVKPVDIELIEKPVSTDYSHYCRALIPDDEFMRVIKSDSSAEISSNEMFCGGRTYYDLSRIIPKHYTVIDIGCGYNSQAYFFTNHARYIGVEPSKSDMENGWHFERFKPQGTEFYNCTAKEFIRDILPGLHLDLDTTFAICNYVPNGYGENVPRIVQHNFKNTFIFYPHTKTTKL